MVVVVLAFTGGCSMFRSGPGPEFTKATRAYYDVTAPDLKRYIRADEHLDETDTARRIELIDEFENMLRKAEGERDE